MTDYSVIIPTYNRAKQLQQAIRSLVAQEFSPQEYEILVVDNGSTDETSPLVAQMAQNNPSHIIRSVVEPIPGLVAGRHCGAMNAQGNILCFVDDDITAAPQWLASIAQTFKASNTALVGGRSLPKYATPPPSWLRFLWRDLPGGGTACGHLSLIDLGTQKREIDPWLVWGLNYSITKEALFRCGGFHPDCMPAQLQRYQGDGETGLSDKIKTLGLKAQYHPEALVYHHVPAERLTFQYFEKREYYQGVCDSYSLIRKNGRPTPELQPSPESRIPQKLRKHSLLRTLRHPRRFLHELTRRIDAWKHPQERNDLQTLLKHLQRGYAQGFAFHQQEVIADPELLLWVLRENYFNYSLPA